MGFCTTINPRTGREVFVCDFCGAHPAKRVRCPYNYCQKWAICADCRKAGKAKLSSAGAGTHKEICKVRMDEKAQRMREIETITCTVEIKSSEKDCVLADEDLYVLEGQYFYELCGLAPARVWREREEVLNLIAAHPNWSVVPKSGDARAAALLAIPTPPRTVKNIWI